MEGKIKTWRKKERKKDGERSKEMEGGKKRLIEREMEGERA